MGALPLAKMMTPLLLLMALACGDSHSAEPAPVAEGHPWIAEEDFDPGNFHRSTTIDNRWFPLVPGTRFTWKGQATVDGKRVSRAVVLTVTDLTKTVDGVRTLVAWDRDYTAGVAEEVELAFFAQDDGGNVWYFGEYPEEYEHGKIVKAPAWLAGVHGATPGVLMQAVPRTGTRSYAEGWGPEVHWNDRARAYRTDQHTCVPVGCYHDVVVIDEFSRDEPGAHQLKFYAPGVGGIRVGWRGQKEEEREVLVLTDLERLDAAAMDQVRERVLQQEARAYRISDAYARTAPIEGGQ